MNKNMSWPCDPLECLILFGVSLGDHSGKGVVTLILKEEQLQFFKKTLGSKYTNTIIAKNIVFRIKKSEK